METFRVRESSEKGRTKVVIAAGDEGGLRAADQERFIGRPVKTFITELRYPRPSPGDLPG